MIVVGRDIWFVGFKLNIVSVDVFGIIGIYLYDVYFVNIVVLDDCMVFCVYEVFVRSYWFFVYVVDNIVVVVIYELFFDVLNVMF